jgi:hypothetical protein
MNNKAKFLIKSIAVMVLFLAAATAFAANGDTINIGGVVPLSLTLEVTVDADVDNLLLTATDLPATKDVASIVITTNNTSGWELIIYSANGANLLNADGDDIPYTLTYAGVGGVATTAPTTGGLLFGEESGTSASPATGDPAGDLNITYVQSTSGYAAGYYSDQLTLVLRAK